MKDMEAKVRELCKTNKHQTLYQAFKECNLTLFANTHDYTYLQIIYLNYLVFYHNLYTDIAMDEVDEVVLEDEIYEDAYTLYKRKTRVKKIRDSYQSPVTSSKGDKTGKETQLVNKTSWVFKKPKK